MGTTPGSPPSRPGNRRTGARPGHARAGPARRIAHRILLRVAEEGAWASRLLEALDAESLDPRDVALVHEMVLGVLRWRARLDDRIRRACSRSFDRLDAPVREALRLGAYQLIFLDRVPSHAAVDESVALARSTPLPGRKGEGVRAAAAGRAAAGLVNAVLRRIAREEEAAARGGTPGEARGGAPAQARGGAPAEDRGGAAAQVRGRAPVEDRGGEDAGRPAGPRGHETSPGHEGSGSLDRPGTAERRRGQREAAPSVPGDPRDAGEPGDTGEGAPGVVFVGRGFVRRLAAELSHPVWMVERALARFGEEEARAWLLANNQPPPVTLRPNPGRPESADLAALLRLEGVETEPARVAPGALRVLDGRAVRTSLFARGAFWIQDEASQLVPLLFPPPWNGLTADLCAAPGGKAFVLATGRCGPDAVGGEGEAGRVVAFDLHPHRLARLLEGAQRIAPGRIAAVAAEMAAAAPVRDGLFDRVLVDAPCSGTGVLRRHPEIRWRLERARLAELAALQSRLLDAAFAMLRPGGWLVYSVCSIEPEEGDRVVDAFLARSGSLAVDPRPHLPASARALVGEDGRLRTFAHRHGCDAFFAALLRKTTGPPPRCASPGRFPIEYPAH